MSELWIVMQARANATRIGDTLVAGMPDQDLRVPGYAGMLPCFTSERSALDYADKLDPVPGVLHVTQRSKK